VRVPVSGAGADPAMGNVLLTVIRIAP